jgi:hypothetical protein
VYGHELPTKMQQVKTIKFPYNGKDYEIRVFSDGADYRAAGYLDGRQVTSGYIVQMETDFDFRSYTGDWAHDHLIDAIKDDIKQGRVAH